MFQTSSASVDFDRDEPPDLGEAAHAWRQNAESKLMTTVVLPTALLPGTPSGRL